jgi:diguanylate cyclase (GGDEF)-like protein
MVCHGKIPGLDNAKCLTKAISLFILVMVFNMHCAIADNNRANIRFVHMGVDQGLSQETVLAITQGSQGFMWFGTQAGLNRYDGYNFKVYRHDETEPRSLSADWVFSIAQETNGGLWVGTDGGGLNLFDPHTETFFHFRHDANNANSISSDNVRALLTDATGMLWVGTDAGLNSYDALHNKFRSYALAKNPNAGLNSVKVKITAIIEDPSGFIWIGTDGHGLHQLDPNTGLLNNYLNDPHALSSLHSDKIRSLFIDTKQRIWIGSYDNGLSILNKDRNTFTGIASDPQKPNGLSSAMIKAIYQDNDNKIWLATDNGLDQWREQSQDFIHLKNDPQNIYSLTGNKISSIFQDNGGVFWVGSHTGINKWNTATADFSHYRTVPDKKYSLSSNAINAFAQNQDGNIWVGSYDGLNLLDQRNQQVRTFDINQDDNSLSDARVMSLHTGADDILWIGTRGSGLDRFDLEKNSFTHFIHDPSNANSLSSNAVTTIKKAGNNQLWIGTWGGGLNLLDTQSNTFSHYRHQPGDATSISSDRVLSLLADSTGLLWIGTWGEGVSLFNPASGKVSAIMAHTADTLSISSNNVSAMHEDKTGNIWFATHGGGLNLLSAKNRYARQYKFKRYSLHHGMPSNVIYGILEDNKGYLWLSGNRGLVKFDPASGSIITYNTSHGLQGNEFNNGASFKAANGEMYFGGTNGVTAFFPDSIKPNVHAPPVVMTRFLKMNQEVRHKQALGHGDTVELTYLDYLVAFEFTGLDYAAPERNRYRFKLEGFDKSWIEAGTMRRATYTNLPTGQYRLKIIAANNDGIWNQQGMVLQLTVLPPPWQSWWAYLVYIVLLASGALILFKAHQDKLAKAMRYHIELECEVDTRTHELRIVNEQLLTASITDQLTGLNNRRYLGTIATPAVAKIDRTYHLTAVTDVQFSPKLPCPRLFILMLDLDGLKQINDTYGHSAGDQVIITTGQLLRKVCRQSDTLIRWGGDEFIVMGNVNDVEEVSLLAERLRHNIDLTPFDIGSIQKLHLSCSIGFSFYPFSPAYPKLVSWDQVQLLADKALYHSKQQGRNAWHSIQATKNRPPLSLITMLVQDPDKAIEQGYAKLVGTRKQVPKFTKD